jgi:ABC-2 type transport system ATP-binding protein
MTKKTTVVQVQNLSKTFHIPLDASNGIKQKLLNFVKGRKGYRDFTPLDNISFEIEEGEFFGIVGRNGSGKSTLLKAIAGIYQPDIGSVSVNGMLVPFIELGVGFNPELTGRENVFLNGALLGFSRKEMEAMYAEIVAFAELSDFMDERLKNYSSGMQVRLAFSIAIKAQGDILLLDEVLAVGDEAFQQKCFNYFNELKTNKKTVVIVTHDMSAVERFCTRAMVIEKGRIKLIGRPIEVANEYRRENMPVQVTAEGGLRKKNADSIKLSVNETADSAIVTFDIQSIIPKEEYYVGLTIYKNDSNIGEINSLNGPDGALITYSIDKRLLNPGRYDISAALFRKSNRSLLAIADSQQQFLVSGHDTTRGGGMKLADTWASLDEQPQ